MLQTSLLLMKSPNKTETPIFLSVLCSLFPKAIFFTFILLHCSWYYCRVTAVERLPVLYHSADYIHFLWVIGPIVESLKMEFCSCIR